MNADNLSLVERAPTVPEWRAVRKALPLPLRRRLRLNPPQHAPTAKALLESVLRSQRAMEAAEALTTWEPKIADIARAGGIDRSTVGNWVKDSPGVCTARGRVIFQGVRPDQLEQLDERLAAKQPIPTAAPSDAADQCSHVLIGKSLEHQQVMTPDPGPMPFRSLAFNDIGTVLADAANAYDQPLSVAEQPYDPIGRKSESVTVTELVTLTENKISAKTVRKLIRECGLDLAPRQAIDVNWFASEAGKIFWLEVAKMKTRA